MKRLRATSHAALSVVIMAMAIAAILWIRSLIKPELRARNHVETVITVLLIACSTIAIFTTIGIVLSVLYEAIRFFKVIPLSEFLLGLEWSPQMAIRADQVGSSGAFGAIPVFHGHHPDFLYCHVRCRAHRPDVRHLPVRVCQ